MDLRPKIAAEIVDALIDQIGVQGWDRIASREALVALALSKMVSRSLPLRHLSTDDPELIQRFLAKYPGLEVALADCREKARKIWPDVDTALELHSDPESCHTCYEGQSLRVYVLFVSSGDDLADEARIRAFDDAWLDYPGAFGPESDPVLDLFRPLPRRHPGSLPTRRPWGRT